MKYSEDIAISLDYRNCEVQTQCHHAAYRALRVVRSHVLEQALPSTAENPQTTMSDERSMVQRVKGCHLGDYVDYHSIEVWELFDIFSY